MALRLSPMAHSGRVLLPLLCLGLLTSCLEKLEKFLPKPPAPKQAPVEAETPMTPEEEAAQKSLETNTMQTPGPETASEESEEPAFELNKSSTVSLLLYHDFVPRLPRNEMQVSVPVFRAQLQALKDANIPVIPMSDLIAWKKGEKNIPDEAVVITIDDGWVGTYEHAFPILKEFGYPFTLYLYKKFVGTGGRSMTVAQIQEMLANGCELGSHTLSHDALVLSRSKMTPEKYQQWLRAEIVDSKKWLEDTFHVPCQTLAYPYGNKNEEVVRVTMEAGYDGAVTVNPQKTSWDTANGEIPRFTQLADKDANFRIATSFHGSGGNIANSRFIKNDAVDETGQKLVELFPTPDSTVTERRPVIKADLSKLGPIVPGTVAMRVSGFGVVPLEYDAAAQVALFRVPQRLRRTDCNVRLSFRREGADKDEIVNWQFNIDQSASYLPQDQASATPEPAPAAAGS